MKKYLQNYRKSSKPLTLNNLLNFLVAKFRRIFSGDWAKRQRVWRTSQIKINSPECYDKGYCKSCYCSVNSDTDKDSLEWATKSCDNNCYPVWKNKEEWLEFEYIETHKREL